MKKLLVMIFILSVLFLMSIQPLIMVISLIFITLMYSLYIYVMIGGYWFSYALVMVMLSGVLVVFTYMVSLIPNESFEVYSLVFMVVFMIMFVEMKYEEYGGDVGIVSLDLWVSCIGGLNLFLVVFLLSMMIMVVWLSCLGEGALRGE